MFGDLGKIMKMAKDMRERMPAMQEELANKEFTADAGGGAVRATVSGRGELLRVRIDPEVVRDGDVELLEDLVKSAVSAAQSQATLAAAEMMQQITGGLQLPPGLEGLLG